MIKRSPLVLGKKTYETVTNDIAGLVERFPDRAFLRPRWRPGLVADFLARSGSHRLVGDGIDGVNHRSGGGRTSSPSFFGSVSVTPER